MSIRIPVASRNAGVNAICDRADAGTGPGKLRIFTGNRPATPDDAASGTLLAEAILADPAFGAAANGSKTLADPGPVTGQNAGQAGYFRVVDSDSNVVLEGTCGGTGSGADLILSNTNIAAGQTVDVQAGGTIILPTGS